MPVTEMGKKKKKKYHQRKVDKALWELFKQAAKEKGKSTWLYQEEAYKEKLARDGF